jgi:hypothetical protein
MTTSGITMNQRVLLVPLSDHEERLWSPGTIHFVGSEDVDAVVVEMEVEVGRVVVVDVADDVDEVVEEEVAEGDEADAVDDDDDVDDEDVDEPDVELDCVVPVELDDVDEVEVVDVVRTAWIPKAYTRLL